MKVKIQKWHGVATWRWDLPEDDVCGICQNQFDGTCPTCKYPGDECSLCKSKHLLEVSSTVFGLRPCSGAAIRHACCPKAFVNDRVCFVSIWLTAMLFLVSGKCGHNFHMVWCRRSALPGRLFTGKHRPQSSAAHNG